MKESRRIFHWEDIVYYLNLNKGKLLLGSRKSQHKVSSPGNLTPSTGKAKQLKQSKTVAFEYKGENGKSIVETIDNCERPSA